MKKLTRNRRGETLTEVLVAILVIGASIALLVGMVNASMAINRQVREMDMGDDGFYAALSDVETHAFTDADADIAVQATGESKTPIPFSDVRSYTSQGGNTLTVYGTKEG